MQLAITAAHELRQPMTAIYGFMEILNDKLGRGESAAHEMEIVIDQCKRMDNIIKRMLNITSYRVRVYDANTEILDLEPEPETASEKAE
jgi:signal transduction histidine kinase